MATPPNQRRPVKPPEDDARSVAGLTLDARTILTDNVARLERPDLQRVARSLLAAPFPSSAQNAYIESLALTAVPRRSHRIGHAERIFDLFDEAKKHIDGPGITLRAATVALRLELESDVNLNLSNGHRGSDRIWHGRLSRDGEFDPHSDEAKNHQ